MLSFEQVIPNTTQRQLFIDFFNGATSNIIYIYGNGSNGKSTILLALRKIFNIINLPNDFMTIPNHHYFDNSFIYCLQDPDQNNINTIINNLKTLQLRCIIISNCQCPVPHLSQIKFPIHISSTNITESDIDTLANQIKNYL